MLEHVFAMRGGDCASGAVLVRSAAEVKGREWHGRVLYFAGGVPVLHDTDKNTQVPCDLGMRDVTAQASPSTHSDAGPTGRGARRLR